MSDREQQRGGELKAPTIKRILMIGVSLLIGTLVTGCRILQTAVDVPGQAIRTVTPGKKDKNAADPVEVQQTLLRFADEFSTRMTLGIDKLRHGTNALERAEILQWKIALSTETCSIASGPSPVANLLDMTIFVTVTRIALEEHWQPKVFGESAKPMLESCRNAETEVWRLTDTVLTPKQKTELLQAIETWHQQNPLPESVLAARALGFAAQVAEDTKVDTAKPGSVFSLLKVDPLAGMDPAVREIAQTRLFAERALYVSQKMPMLLRWQIELMSVNALELPTVQQLVTNSTQIAASVERFARVAEQLPGQVSTERVEIFKALESQEKNLTPLVSEVHQTLTTLDAVMKRFGVGETNNASAVKTNAEPFRIQDYTQTAAQLGTTARQLTELLVTLDRTIGSTNLAQLAGQIAPVVQQAQTGGKELVDYAFWKGVLLVAIVLVAFLIYRVFPLGRYKGNSP